MEDPPLSQSGQPTVIQSSDAIFRELESRDWAADADFQTGLGSILTPLKEGGAPPEQMLETEARAKVFYFAQQTGHDITYEDYLEWKQQQGSETVDATGAGGSVQRSTEDTHAATSTPAQQPYPASFDAIVELIASARTSEIPGIRDIPLVINEEQPAPPSMPAKVKPWERTTAIQTETTAASPEEA